MPVFLPNLKKRGFLDPVQMNICNVGSRKHNISDDYASQGWEIFAPNLTIYGFDADVDACDAANVEIENREITWQEFHIPLALGKAIEPRNLYVTKHPMCSSLYPPNEAYLQRFADLSDVASLDFSLMIDTTTLDQFCQDEEIDRIDFLQIDVQGADLDVLQGSKKILESGTMAVQVEVEFSHLYKNQPLFADVDTFLRAHGFTLFDLSHSSAIRANSPVRSTLRAGQLLWGDAIYFRDLISDDLHSSSLKTPSNMFMLACIADMMSFPDYASEILQYLTLNYGNDPNYNFNDIIIESIAQLEV